MERKNPWFETWLCNAHMSCLSFWYIGLPVDGEVIRTGVNVWTKVQRWKMPKPMTLWLYQRAARTRVAGHIHSLPINLVSRFCTFGAGHVGHSMSVTTGGPELRRVSHVILNVSGIYSAQWTLDASYMLSASLILGISWSFQVFLPIFTSICLARFIYPPYVTG